MASSLQAPARLRAEVGTLDLNVLEAIDVHTHPPSEVTPSESQAAQDRDFAEALVGGTAVEGRNKDVLAEDLLHRSRAHFAHNPRVLQLTEYIARVYGVKPSVEATDAAVANKIGAGYSSYVQSTLNRENITSVLLQSNSVAPTRPRTLIPDDRFEWSYSVGPMLLPAWARDRRIASIQDLATANDAILEECVKNGCRGFKVPIAYYRPLEIKPVKPAIAEEDLRTALRLTESGSVPAGLFQEYFRASSSYQDYLLNRIYVKAGELGRPIIIHTAVGLHPDLRFDFNSPLGLYDVFMSDDILRAETSFVLIHGGYPYHHNIAALISQFPNVYTDVSFYCQYPGSLEAVLRAFLGLAPSEKVMFGSDGSVPERWAMCASNMRQALAKILNDYHTSYGWSLSDCERIAKNILSENAKRVYGFQASNIVET